MRGSNENRRERNQSDQKEHTSSAIVSVVCKVVKTKGKGYGDIERWSERGAGYQSEKE